MGWGLSHNLGASGTSLAPHLSRHLAKTQGNVGPTGLSDFHEWSAWRLLAAFIFLKWETLRLCVAWGKLGGIRVPQGNWSHGEVPWGLLGVTGMKKPPCLDDVWGFLISWFCFSIQLTLALVTVNTDQHDTVLLGG